MAEIPLAEQIKEVERVVAQRARTGATVDAFLSDIFHAEILAGVKSKVLEENAALEAALGTLKRLDAHRPQPSPSEPLCKECEYYYYPETNEDGWRCATCGHRPGEPAGFSPQLDRERIWFKVGGILHDACDADLIYVSNGTGADLLTSAVADRCVKESRFDQYSILLFLLEEEAPSHAEYWKGVSEGILAGADPRDRCHCGKLANGSQYSSAGWKRYCSWEHMPPARAEMFASADTNGGTNESIANNGD